MSTIQYVVLDDMPLKQMYPLKGLIGSQNEFYVTQKYLRNTLIHHGKQLIILCNESILSSPDLTAGELEWLNGNLETITLINPLY